MTLGLVMIVKDEAHGIRATLESVKAAIDHWTIVDTGSTDGTQEIVEEVLRDLPGELHRAPFVDFATTRNLALDLAEPRADYQLMLSGDEILHGAVALKEFCRDASHEVYDLDIVLGETVYRSPRLTRSGAGWRYEGATHEALVKAEHCPSEKIPGVKILHFANADAKRKRWQLDLTLLTSALATDPVNPRTWFYLAQTYECLGSYAEALELYHRRVQLGGWAEEVYEAKFRIARVLKLLGTSWPEVQQAYLEAHAFDPRRAEPLHAIAQHYYEQKNHAMTFLFAQRAAALPTPECRLFVDAEVYTVKAHDLVATSAYYLGHHEIGRAAAEKAVAMRPNDPRLLKNLSFYEVSP
jgi:tetratricopeptide (TPR) repeat protein